MEVSQIPMGVYYDSELEHHGILGMKWGVRRFQNPDGTLTPEGKERYYGTKESNKLAKGLNEVYPYGNSRAKDKLMNSVQLKNVAASVRKDHNAIHALDKESNKIQSDFYKRDDYKSWVEKAARADWNKHRKEYESDEYEDGGWTFDKLLNWCLHGDGAQGSRDPFEYWLKNSNDPAVKTYINNINKRNKLQEAYIAKCESLIKGYLGEHAEDGGTYTSIYGGTKTGRLAGKGIPIVNSIMKSWDTYEDNFDPGAVSISDLMRLVN